MQDLPPMPWALRYWSRPALHRTIMLSFLLNRGILMASAFLMASMLGSCASIVKERGFSVDDIWVDQEFVWIKYRRDSATTIITYANVHSGMEISSESQSYLTKIRRSLIKDSHIINLQDTNPINADLLVYQDSDASLKKLPDGRFTLLGKSDGTSFFSCNSKLWDVRRVIRHADRLFFCGRLFDISGRQLWQLSDAFATEVIALLLEDQDTHKRGWGGEALSATFTHDNKLLLTVSGYGFVQVDLSNAEVIEKMIKPQIPESPIRTFYYLTYFTYTPYGGFVLTRSFYGRDKNTDYLCTIDTCKPLSLWQNASSSVLDIPAGIVYQVGGVGYDLPVVEVRSSLLSEAFQ